MLLRYDLPSRRSQYYKKDELLKVFNTGSKNIQIVSSVSLVNMNIANAEYSIVPTGYVREDLRPTETKSFVTFDDYVIYINKSIMAIWYNNTSCKLVTTNSIYGFYPTDVGFYAMMISDNDFLNQIGYKFKDKEFFLGYNRNNKISYKEQDLKTFKREICLSRSGL